MVFIILGDQRNNQAVLLEDYWKKVVLNDSENGEEPVKYHEVSSLKDFGEHAAKLDGHDMVIVYFNNAQADFYMEIINKMIRSEESMHAALLIFQNESQQFDNLACIRSHSLGEMEKFQILPVYFNSFKQKVPDKSEILENLVFGVLFGRFSILNPPLKRAYSSLSSSSLSDIVEHVCPPEGKVAIVTAGVPLIQIHKADMKHKITYFGTNEDVEDGESSEESSEDSDVSKSEEINDESSTSPF